MPSNLIVFTICKKNIWGLICTTCIMQGQKVAPYFSFHNVTVFGKLFDFVSRCLCVSFICFRFLLTVLEEGYIEKQFSKTAWQ
jgi:hypothetical protein